MVTIVRFFNHISESPHQKIDMESYAPALSMKNVMHQRLKWWQSKANNASNFSLSIQSLNDRASIHYELPWGGKGEVESITLMLPPKDVGGADVGGVVRAAVGLPRAVYAFLIDGFPVDKELSRLMACQIRYVFFLNFIWSTMSCFY